MRFIFTILIALLCCSEARAVSESAKTAIVRVEVRGETVSGAYVRYGTGFVVGNGLYVITARHLLYPKSPWKKDELTQVDRNSVYVVLRGSNGLLNDRRLARANLQNELADIALLTFAGDPAPNRLSTCPDPSFDGNPSLSTFGFASLADENGNDKSFDETLSVSSGVLNDPSQKDLGQYRISMPTRPGFSGAPVFLNEQVVGVLTGGNDGRLAASAISLFTPLRTLRSNMLAVCDAKCRLPSHGIEGYHKQERLSFESDWSGDHMSPRDYCEARLKDLVASASGRKFILREVTEAVSEATRDGAKQNVYKYKCSFDEMSSEFYREAEDPLCPSQVQVQALPR